MSRSFYYCDPFSTAEEAAVERIVPLMPDWELLIVPLPKFG